MAHLGPSDYRTSQPALSGHEHAEGIMDQVNETAGAVGERAGIMVGDLGTAIKERPYTTLAIAAGLAFAVGALWKLGHQRPQTRLEALGARMPDVRAHMPDISSWEGLLPRRWR